MNLNAIFRVREEREISGGEGVGGGESIERKKRFQ